MSSFATRKLTYGPVKRPTLASPPLTKFHAPFPSSCMKPGSQLGRLKKHEDVVIMDLPGIYSLSPYTLEEVVARNYLINERPDACLLYTSRCV